MLDDLLGRFRRRDRHALARLLSLAARGEQVDDIWRGVGNPERPARVVALTGGGGVGKSTLAGRLTAQARAHGQTVAVLACDPQSPLSGGALLGDRFRMTPPAGDDGVFIRSLAAAGGRGAVAEHLAVLIRLCECFGFDVVLVETVGAGQGDTAVRDLVDVLVLLLQPETGDDLQWEKAGLLEVADVVVVQKADLPGAERVEAQVLTTLALSAAKAPPVVRVSARTGAGVEALWTAITACPPRRAAEKLFLTDPKDRHKIQCRNPSPPFRGGRFMEDSIPLAQMLASVTEELHNAQAAALAKGQAVMQFAECELEFAVAAAVEGKAGVKLYVVNLGGGVKRTETNTIRVKFKNIPGHALQVPQITEGAAGPELKKQDAPSP